MHYIYEEDKTIDGENNSLRYWQIVIMIVYMFNMVGLESLEMNTYTSVLYLKGTTWSWTLVPRVGSGPVC
jgi:hypothetical protein